MMKTLGMIAASAMLVWAGAAASEIEHVSPEPKPLKVGLAGEQPPDIARFLLSRGALSAKISPDGERIALLLDTTGLRQIWIMPAAGGTPEQITFGNGVTFFEWTPDGRALLYGADNDGDEQEAYYLISVDGKSERLVLPAAEGGFRQFGAFSPDGARFAYASTERNGDDYDIYVADLASGESQMIFEGRYHFAAEAWIPGGAKLMVSEAVGEDGNNLYTLDAQTGALTPLFRPESPANFTSGFGGGEAFAPAPDGARVYFSTNYGREFLALGYYDFAEEAFTLIAEEDDADIESPVLCGDRYLVWRVNREGFDALKARDLRRGRDIPVPPLPEGVLGLSCARETPRLLVKVSAHDTPGDVYIWNIGAREAARVFSSTLAGLKAEDFVKPVSVRAPARDGVMLQGLLYLPKNHGADEKPPVLFDVHGGPTGQSKAGFDPVTQYHVARGVAVFEPNVRGSTGFGRTYLNLDNREKRLDSVRDLVDLLAWLDEDGRVDARRAAVKGGSYGGYMVNAVLGAYPDAFDAGVCLFGVGDWVTALEVASPALKASDRVEYGDIADPRWRAFYEEISPVRNADRIRVPVLYSHGARDPRIDKAETEVMVRALRRNGIKAPYILIPDEGHGWRKLANKLFYYRREAAFLGEVFAE
ncbi:S9 family peptidase [Amphiplicatus metriothermophilus]|uniref:Dipeptidyl aminopeptidase/acylaminoacyl peptidase n=1 Tax=Amphiplicatus metriothermophilus TaxID=1519374 RepID=A0A239PTC2_9PROT|nr:S9 family peptidase [Amphiplicatus metriothermophilus]MBB5519397.1 dipeptidyl aminopeptidase/acylaminoacyl peptidase [Amphiplicatus metriothermophilus]SNT73539.1 Dipeptidyl aminopeptidase/acylaminoacyl peptidase [Amphiplicatus metriothermophilus]